MTCLNDYTNVDCFTSRYVVKCNAVKVINNQIVTIHWHYKLTNIHDTNVTITNKFTKLSQLDCWTVCIPCISEWQLVSQL